MDNETKYSRRDFLKKTVGAVGFATAVGGCASQYQPLDKDIVKQKYLHDLNFNYPAELDGICKKYSEEGKILEDILTRGGWALAVVNDAAEVASACIAGFVGKVTGGEKGERDSINFTKYVFDGLPGGRTYNHVHSELLSLNLEGAIKVAYDVETTKLGGHGKLILLGASDATAIVLPLIKHSKAKAKPALVSRPAPGQPPF